MTEPISVVYCPAPDEVWQVTLPFVGSLTVAQALERSGVLQDHPALNNEPLSFGIFGQVCLPDRVLLPGDRVEIYRPLFFDPMQSRRRRAAHRLAQAKKAKKPQAEKQKSENTKR